jgi:hypothetical protein
MPMPTATAYAALPIFSPLDTSVDASRPFLIMCQPITTCSDRARKTAVQYYDTKTLRLAQTACIPVAMASCSLLRAREVFKKAQLVPGSPRRRSLILTDTAYSLLKQELGSRSASLLGALSSHDLAFPVPSSLLKLWSPWASAW